MTACDTRYTWLDGVIADTVAPSRSCAAAVLDRLPDARQRRRGRGHRPGGVPALPPRARAGTEIGSPKAYLVGRRRRGSRIDQLRSARVAPRALRRHVAAGAAADGADGGRRRQAETADSLSMAFLVVLERLSPGGAGGLPAARRVRLRLRGDRGRRRQDRGQLPADRRPRPAARRGAQAALRGVPRQARRAGPALLRRGRDGRHWTASRACSPPTSCSTATAAARPRVAAPDPRPRARGPAPAGLARQARAPGLVLGRRGQRPAGRRVRRPRRAARQRVALDIADGVVQTVRSIVNPDKLATSAPSPTTVRCCAGRS